ncbi:formylglycine-generating enzyme family protein [Engelhardtia mirabilis]|uniref:Formylglycine-generating sulfatase enzyme n=1 Tax=Engelhardtia mirabilis TaxID=2528011 RepID=A0A518BSK2_9BACT|nr:Formylglycine-generating sulfatase enzyme [Planctomycetes bacterium Pla133]QDV04277.1 Formylglycine-generating sulfatase enzyme [Planctomycetes bacterium Pla86]
MDPDPEVVTDEGARARMVATGWPWRVRHRESGAELLLVPPGEFMRGSLEESDEYMPDEYPPQHMIVDRPYYLARTELTRAQWLAVMEPGPESWGENDGDKPATDVTFDQIQEFLGQSGLGLPRNSEWEYACRAGTTGQRYGPIDEIAWYSDNSTEPMPVGLLKPNAWGFYDTIGNVWEFTSTFQQDLRRYWTKEPQTVIAEDEIQSLKRSIRGGGGGLQPIDMRAPYCLGQFPDRARNSVGLRAAFHLPNATVTGGESDG